MVTNFEFSDGNWTFDPTVPARVAAGIQERITSRASRMNDDEQGDGFHYLEDAQDESDEFGITMDASTLYRMLAGQRKTDRILAA